ncbi:expressed unknown protein [Seminavis robusta]|uniref:Uncharacterized protein n=1 Tax=Seminavis robusta TaxID=568900 RepID=A0A9N8E7Z8_9STRA|nr:expressed unknown protein [Seminavis robusta]|eukprot:Sro769_g199730.1 n/a (434) ;mRNA; r:1806-3107
MEKVVDRVHKMSLNHWKVGPVQGDFQVNNDLQARGYSSGPSSEYNLMDEQVKMATAAALAARAMEHEREQRSSFAYQIHQHRQSSRSRNHRDDPSPTARQQQVREVFQGIREKTPEYWKSVVQSVQEHKEKTPVYLNKVVQTVREHGDKTPEYVNKVVQTVREHKVVQTVRERVFRNQDDGRLQNRYDCDAAGRQIPGDASPYVGSLNEEEQREQPPTSFHFPDGSQIRERCVQVCNKVRALQGLKPLPTSPVTGARPHQKDDAEYYVNFHDGDAVSAINGAMTITQSSYQRPAIEPQTTGDGYANMSSSEQDGDEVAQRKPSVAEQRVLDRRPESQKSLQPFHWGSDPQIQETTVAENGKGADPLAQLDGDKRQLGEETDSQSTTATEATDPADEEDDAGEEALNDLPTMHSTAKFQWSAEATTANATTHGS